MTIYNATHVPASYAPKSNANADFPGCVAWFQLMEDTKIHTTALTDKIGTITALEIVQGGTGDADSVAHALTTESSTGNKTYADTGSLLTIGTNSLIIELDLDLAKTGDNGGAIIQNGDPHNSAKRGWYINSPTATGSLQFIVRNTANSGTVSSTLGSSPDLSGGRKHTCIVWDRTGTDPGSLTYYVEGVKQADYALSGAVGTNHDPATGQFTIGWRDASSLIAEMSIYNVRLWSLSIIPTNIAAIVVEMAKDPDEFPQLMNGIT